MGVNGHTSCSLCSTWSRTRGHSDLSGTRSETRSRRHGTAPYMSMDPSRAACSSISSLDLIVSCDQACKDMVQESQTCRLSLPKITHQLGLTRDMPRPLLGFACENRPSTSTSKCHAALLPALHQTSFAEQIISLDRSSRLPLGQTHPPHAVSDSLGISTSLVLYTFSPVALTLYCVLNKRIAQCPR